MTGRIVSYRTTAGWHSLGFALCSLLVALTALPAMSAAQSPQRSAPAQHKAHRAPKALTKKPAAHRTAAAKPKVHPAKKAPRRAPAANRVALHKGHKVQSAPRPHSGHHAATDANLNPSHRPYAPPGEKPVEVIPGQQRPTEHAGTPTASAESNQLAKSPTAPTPPASPLVGSPKTPVSPTPPVLPKGDSPPAQVVPDKP